MAAHCALRRLRHGDHSGPRNFQRFKTFVHGEPVHKWKSIRKACPHIVQREDAMVGGDLSLERLFVASRVRLGHKIFNDVRPARFRTDPLVLECLDPVADHGSRIRCDGPFDHALVVINEQPARIEKRDAVPALGVGRRHQHDVAGRRVICLVGVSGDAARAPHRRLFQGARRERQSCRA